MERRLMDINEASSYLGTNQQCLRMRLWRKQIPAKVIVRISGRVYFDKVELDGWIDELKADDGLRR